MSTITQQSATDTITGGDLLALWKTNNGDTRKASITLLAEYMQNNLTFTADDISAVEVFDNLRVLVPPSLDVYVVNVLGGTAINDGKGGLFHWNSTSVQADDGKNVIKVDSISVGRYLRASSFIYTADTIADFPLNIEDGSICTIKDLVRGGTFVYDSSEVANDDQGINFNGWLRLYEGLINSNWYTDFDASATALDGAEIDDGGLWQSICDAKGKGAIWKFGNNYQILGTAVNPASYVFLHDYRPLLPYPTDGANVYLGGRAGSFSAAPDAGAIGNYNIHSSYNTALGHQALNNLTTAYNCTMTGVNAGRYTTEGYGNTFNGRDAGSSNTIGFYNNAFGQSALFLNETGNQNIAMGVTALRNIDGVGSDQNIGIGLDALFSMTAGTRNVGIGYQAGFGITSGDANTFIGNTPIANYPNGVVDGLLLICAGQVPRIQGDSTGRLSLSGDVPTARLEYLDNDATVYDGAAVDGQIDKGSTLLIGNSGSINNGIAQLVLQSRSGNPYCRIVATGGLTPTLRFITDDSEKIFINETGALRPTVDNTQQLGGASNRWSVVFAGTGTINTSDDREKSYIDILDVEKLVALDLKANMRKFKYNDAIELKGVDGARIHFGASAQTVKTIFENHGLVAEDYALLCFDEWEAEYEQVVVTDAVYEQVLIEEATYEQVMDVPGHLDLETKQPVEPTYKDGELLKEATYKNGELLEETTYRDGALIKEAGNRYGLRYEELLSFIISAI